LVGAKGASRVPSPGVAAIVLIGADEKHRDALRPRASGRELQLAVDIGGFAAHPGKMR